MALPAVLVLGGLGMVGRNFVKYLVEAGGEELVSHIRVVDKTIPVMAHLTEEFSKIFSHPLVELVQGDLNNDAVLAKVFIPPAQMAAQTYQLVVNLAAPSNYNLPESMYPIVITNLRVKCATKARDMGCDKYIEVSTAQVYKTSGHKPAKESDLAALKPWTVLAKHHLAAEQAIAQLSGLNWVVLRLPCVYGPGDVAGLMPRIACAAAYQYAGSTMRLLWGDDLRMHTLHVQDAAAALWFLFCAGEVGEVYNVADDNDTTQGKFNKVLEACFSPLQTSCAGVVVNTLAQAKGLDAVAQEANQEHLETWLEMTSQTGTSYTPVTTEVHRELLGDNAVQVDSAKIKALGFQCSCPAPDVELVQDSIQYWISQKKFPVAK